jgi:hypothetical protein
MLDQAGLAHACRINVCVPWILNTRRWLPGLEKQDLTAASPRSSAGWGLSLTLR